MTTETVTTRDRIRAEAAALYRAKGFNGTSMSDLAAAVGITKSSLYHHFPSKQSLLSEIIELTVNRVAPLIQAVVDAEGPVGDRLARAVSIHTVEAIHDRDAVACFIEEGRYLDPDFMQEHIENRDRYEDLFRALVKEGIASGEFEDQDPGLTVKAILGMCNSVVRWYRDDGTLSPDDIAAQFAAIAVRGVTRPDRRRE